MALVLLQSQGIDLVNQRQEAANQVVIEKTLANTQRIQSLEKNVQGLNDKIDEGFSSLREQLRADSDRFTQIVSDLGRDRWTRVDQAGYEKVVTERFRLLEERQRELEKSIK